MFKNLIYLGLAALITVGCNKSNDAPQTPKGDISPFVSGDILESAKGEFFASECVKISDTLSSMEKMTFSFSEPLSWSDEFFEQKSLEFSGRLQIENVTYDNPHCLGLERGKNLLTTSVSLDNISVIRDSLDEHSFKAFYVKEQENDGTDQLDSGSGVLLKIYRENRAFHVQPLNSFTYEGKDFKLAPLQSNTQDMFTFNQIEKPVNNRNLTQMPEGSLKSFFDSSFSCGYYVTIDKSKYSYGDKIHNIMIIFSPYSGGVAMDLDDKEKYGTHIIEKTSNLDWIYVNGEVHTDKNFIFRQEGDKVKIYNERYRINGEELTYSFLSDDRIASFMGKYNRTPDIFQKCQ